MNQLLFRFECLDGTYDFEAQFEENGLHYEIQSTIPELESLSGTLDETETLISKGNTGYGTSQGLI